MQDLCRMFDAAVALAPDRAFFISPDVTLTYAEFDERTDRLVAVLAEHGAASGVPVGILLPSDLELALTYWACQKLGSVAVPLNPMYREREFVGAVAVSGIKMLVTDVARSTQIGESATSGLALLQWDEPGDGSLAARLLSATPVRTRPHVTLDDPACIFLTSGTTGRPKAVVQTQRNQMTALTHLFTSYGLRYGAEVGLNTMPIFNNFGATGIMNLCVFSGASMVTLNRWDPSLALDLISRHSVSAIWGTPTVYVDLCERFDESRHSLGSVRRAFSGGAPVPEPLVERFRALTGVRLAQVYGATETTGPVSAEPLVGRVPQGSVGRLTSGVDVTVVDEAGVSVPPGSVGEIVVSGDLVTPGYLDDPEAHAAAFSHRGWASGDLGYLDEDDFLFLVGRKKEMIISGGNNIYPAEVEALLAEHEAVSTCVVLGLPDDRRGEVPVAVVLRRDTHSATESEIIDFCSRRMAAYKVPRAVHFVDSLPLGPTGKVLRSELARAISTSPDRTA